jgi:hypothetical protein
MNGSAPGRSSLVLKQCLIGVIRVLIASLMLSLLLTPVLGLINHLRNFGLPPDLSSVAQAPIYVQATKNSLAAFLEWYNSSMNGYARFGSGLGMMTGAFWAMGQAKPYFAPARVLTGLTAGFFIGGRIAMMITSDPPIVLGGAIVGALWTAVYLFISGLPSRFRPLPLLNLYAPD